MVAPSVRPSLYVAEADAGLHLLRALPAQHLLLHVPHLPQLLVHGPAAYHTRTAHSASEPAQEHSSRTQQDKNTIQEHNTATQHRSTTQQHNTAQQHKTGAQHRNITQEHNTGAHHRSTTQEHNTRKERTSEWFHIALALGGNMRTVVHRRERQPRRREAASTQGRGRVRLADLALRNLDRADSRSCSFSTSTLPHMYDAYAWKPRTLPHTQCGRAELGGDLGRGRKWGEQQSNESSRVQSSRMESTPSSAQRRHAHAHTRGVPYSMPRPPVRSWSRSSH